MDPFKHLVGLLGRGISPAPRPLPTHRTTQTCRNADTHPCPAWDLNLWSQCSSSQRQYLPQTTRLLRPSVPHFKLIIFLLSLKFKVNSREQSTSSGDNGHLVKKSLLLWNPKVHYHIHKSWLNHSKNFYYIPKCREDMIFVKCCRNLA
jgi:hypothetical protein